jgi:transcriptional regulator with XRE-family HTH domain
MKRNSILPRNIKFAETLHELLDRDRMSATRKEICRRIGISQAVLSQYLHSKSTPRLTTLVGIAEFFGVDLHFLVFGVQSQPPRPIDLGPFEYIDKSLAGLHAKNDAYFSAVARITSALAQEVENAARKVVDESNISGGVVHDNEIFTIEKYSEHTILARLRLDFQFDSSAGQPFRTSPGGRFLPLIAKNLSEGRRYTYILPRDVCDWRQPVKEYRKVLSSMGVTDNDMKQRCKIGVTSAPVVAGCVLYRLDMDRLVTECPHLYQHLSLSVVRDRAGAWLGCTLPPSTRLQANPVMDSFHLEQSRTMIERILKNDFEAI